MNTVLIFFLLIVIGIALFMMMQIFNPDYLIRKSVSLTTTSTRDDIENAKIDAPGSSRYYYGGWLFLHSNEPNYSENVVFNRGNCFVMTLKGSTLNVYVKNNSAATQSVDNTNGTLLDVSGSDTKLHKLISFPNFPFQKWTHFVVNVDGQSVDFYLDGKFIKNAKSPTIINVTSTDAITYGNKYTIGKITRFKRPATSINPQGVWNDYILGSGQNYSVSDYHVDAQVTKNKQVRTEQRLF